MRIARHGQGKGKSDGPAQLLGLGFVAIAVAGCAAVAGNGGHVDILSEGVQKSPEVAADPQQTRGRDEALYLKGVALQERAAELRRQSASAGRSGDNEADRLMQEARQAFHALIKNYPTSRRVAHVYVAFGDYYFNEAQIENASRFYERAAMFTDSDVYSYAVYKLAWCHINLGDHREALSQFVRVLQHANSNPNDPATARIAVQARRDLIHSYSEVGAPARAASFFRRLAPGHEQEMLERLADRYRANGREAEARVVDNLLTPATGHPVGYGTRRVR